MRILRKYEIRRILIKTSFTPPVIILAGQGDERVAAQAIKADAHDYIVKQSQMADVLRLAVRTMPRSLARAKHQTAQLAAIQRTTDQKDPSSSLINIKVKQL